MKPALSELEQQVMKVIWKRGAATAADVQEGLQPERPLKDSTIRTVLARLEAKEYVRHTVEGRTFVYSGIEHPRNVAARAVKQILERFCHGSIESLLTGMVDGEIVDPEELEQIVARLAQGRSAHTGKLKGRKR